MTSERPDLLAKRLDLVAQLRKGDALCRDAAKEIVRQRNLLTRYTERIDALEALVMEQGGRLARVQAEIDRSLLKQDRPADA